MAEAKKAQEGLVVKIGRSRTTMSNLAIKFGKLREEVDKRGHGWAAQTRETLDHEMKRTGYRPRV